MRIFFSVDVHGATAVWRKWLKVPELYKVDVLMLCGDLTGKVLVPIVKQKNGKYKVSYGEEKLSLVTESEIRRVEKKFSDMGIYTYRCDEEEIKLLQHDSRKVDTIFKRKIRERMIEWLDLLVSKVDTRSFKTIVMPGNDDDYVIDDIIRDYEDKGVIWCLERVIEIDGVEIISLAHSNSTPWSTPREASEAELLQMIESLVVRVKDVRRTIFNFHCPPYNTLIDLAPKLDKNLHPVVEVGGMEYVHIGSKAVREAIERYQPLLGLHGHVHESPGIAKIGRTICINPGSEYTEGILKGYVIEITNGKLNNYWRVEG